MQQMGQHAVPLLVRWVSYEQPEIPPPLNHLLRTRALRPVAKFLQQRQMLAWFAPHALRDLGPNAASAIPELGQIVLAHDPGCALAGQTVQVPTNAVAMRAWSSILMILVSSQNYPAVRNCALASTNPVVAHIAGTFNLDPFSGPPLYRQLHGAGETL
jgi:hypothetical protein